MALALHRLGASGCLTKTLDSLNVAVLAAVPRDAANDGPAGSSLLHSELLPELSRMLTAAGACCLRATTSSRARSPEPRTMMRRMTLLLLSCPCHETLIPAASVSLFTAPNQ